MRSPLDGPEALPRRDFLGLTLATPLAAAATLAGAALPLPVVAAPVVPAPAERGYHRSAHIDTYYASLRY